MAEGSTRKGRKGDVLEDGYRGDGPDYQRSSAQNVVGGYRDIAIEHACVIFNAEKTLQVVDEVQIVRTELDSSIVKSNTPANTYKGEVPATASQWRPSLLKALQKLTQHNSSDETDRCRHRRRPMSGMPK